MGKLRRLTRRWIAPAGSRGSGGGASGSPALPGRETGRGQQHGGKARGVVKALMAPPRKARVIWRRPDCLKLSSQGWKCASSDYNAYSEPPASGESPFLRPNPSGWWTVSSELTQGNGRAAYVTLDTSSARGIRDRLRGASPMATECQ